MSREDLIKEAEQLKWKLEEARKTARDTTLSEATSNIESLPKLRFQKRQTLRKHIGKIYSLQWGSDSKELVSVSQGGDLIIWDVHSGYKLKGIGLQSGFVMSVAFSPSREFVASGGLHNNCTVHSVNFPQKYCATSNARGIELIGHTSYISCVKFVEDNQILTSSGDMTCALWDVKHRERVTSFEGHTETVMSVSLCPSNPNIFVSGACDHSAKLWDIRDGTCQQTFLGHESDVNGVTFFPSGQAFATSSDDGTCRLFDIRSDQELQIYKRTSKICGVTSVDFSISGRLLFAGNDDWSCDIWDTLKGEGHGILGGHKREKNRISCIGISPDGIALATGSWDRSLKIWTNSYVKPDEEEGEEKPEVEEGIPLVEIPSQI